MLETQKTESSMDLLPDLEKFEKVCRRIRLNLPEDCRWVWDERFNHALVVFERQHLELILIPIGLEFEQKWDFYSLGSSPEVISKFVEAGFGLIPGQFIYITLHGDDKDLILYAACWPWGDGAKFSLRVGIHSLPPERLGREAIRSLLTDWLEIDH